GNVLEASGLRTVTIYGEWFAFKSLSDEIGYDTPVIEPETRSVAIEDANNSRIQTMHVVISHRDRFSESFRFIVNTTRTNWIHVAPVSLGLRVNFRVSVHFRCARKQILRSFYGSEPERVVSSKRIHF